MTASEAEPRTVDEILAALGDDLRQAAARRRPRRGLRRGLVLVVVLCAVLVPAAVAMLPRTAPDLARPAGARAPDAVSQPVTVASGPGWKLSASTCRFGSHRTVALFLAVPDGGAGRRCDALSPAVAAGPVTPPMQLIDTRRGRDLAFGAAPAGTARVQLLLAGIRAIEVPARTAGQVAVFVAPLPAGARVLGIVGLTAGGSPTVRCTQESCA